MSAGASALLRLIHMNRYVRLACSCWSVSVPAGWTDVNRGDTLPHKETHANTESRGEVRPGRGASGLETGVAARGGRRRTDELGERFLTAGVSTVCPGRLVTPSWINSRADRKEEMGWNMLLLFLTLSGWCGGMSERETDLFSFIPRDVFWTCFEMSFKSYLLCFSASITT